MRAGTYCVEVLLLKDCMGSKRLSLFIPVFQTPAQNLKHNGYFRNIYWVKRSIFKNELDLRKSKMINVMSNQMKECDSDLHTMSRSGEFILSYRRLYIFGIEGQKQMSSFTCPFCRHHEEWIRASKAGLRKSISTAPIIYMHTDGDPGFK